MNASEQINKSTWGEGPWQHEPDREDWVHAGFACFVRRHDDFGFLCGYVGVPKEHPAYGQNYGAIDVDVHGGLTYSDKCHGVLCHTPSPGMPDEVWWFGFDCGHCFDESPGLNARTRVLMTAAGRPKLARGHREEVYRNFEYVKAQTNALADHLAAMRDDQAAVIIPQRDQRLQVAHCRDAPGSLSPLTAPHTIVYSDARGRFSLGRFFSLKAGSGLRIRVKVWRRRP